MADPRITDTRRVVGRVGESMETVEYRWDADEPLTPAERAFAVYLDRDAYLEMGKPEQITVTIEPGDKLNDGQRASGPVIDDPTLETALAAEGIHVGSYDPTHIEGPPPTRLHAERVEEAPCE